MTAENKRVNVFDRNIKIGRDKGPESCRVKECLQFDNAGPVEAA